MQRKGSAVWAGGLKDGNGKVSTGSGGLADAPYTFASRFESGGKTDPEELIAAAHAACFSMALSAGLEKAGTPATTITTKAACTLEIVEGAARITTMELHVRGRVDGIDHAAFVAAAEGAKVNCPVSKALHGNLEVLLDAALES